MKNKNRITLKDIKQKAGQNQKDIIKAVNKMASEPIQLTSYRNERNIMFYPICSTSKGKRLKPINYVSPNGMFFLEVTANHTYGMVKASDIDILMYALSKAGEIKRQTDVFPKAVEFSAYELLKGLGKNTSGKNYSWVKSAIARITSTTYKTNIWKGSKTVFFHLAECEYDDSTNKIERIQIKFNERLLESVINSNMLLKIDEQVVQENRSQLRKRLLSLVNTAMGNKTSWSIGFDNLKNLLSSEDVSDGEFKRTLLERINSPWSIVVEDYKIVTFKIQS